MIREKDMQPPQGLDGSSLLPARQECICSEKRRAHQQLQGESNNFQGLSLYQGMTGVSEFKYPSEREDEMHSNMPGKTN